VVKQLNGISQRQAAVIAGIALLIMAVLAPIANFSIIHKLVVSDDALKTANNIISSPDQFRLGIFLLLIVVILDIITAWALYILLKPVNKSLSLLSAWFRIIYAAIFGSSLFNLVHASRLLSGAGYLKVLDINQLNLHVLLSVKAFFSGWNIGMVIFGLHLLVLGCLVFRSGFIPKLLGILIIISSLGYIMDNSGIILSRYYNLNISMFTFIGELLLIFWLLIYGSRLKVTG
jgi:hypothetical protein